MVKIRLKRQGNKHRPFYRIVVATAEGGRNSRAIENIGHFNPITKPSTIVMDEARALHWLSVGAQPTETVAVLLKKQGILEKYFESNPAARSRFKFLDKTVAPVAAPAHEAAAE